MSVAARPVVEAGPRPGGRPLLAYFGHHKCASTWVNDIVRDVCASAGLSHASVHSPRKFEADLPGFVARSGVDFLAYVNANRRYLDGLPALRGFHVIRDPRDIAVSSYFSHLHSHPTDDWPALVPHREALEAVDKERGLYLVIDFLADVFDDLATWDYARPDVLELRMEEVVAEPERRLLDAFRFLGLVREGGSGASELAARMRSSLRRRRGWLVPFREGALPASVIEDAIRRHDFARKAGGRPAGVENVASHYRKGVPGDWVNHLSAGHRDYFRERYGALLVDLGYETSLDW